jgi:protein TonB
MLAPDIPSMALAGWRNGDEPGPSAPGGRRSTAWTLPVSVALHAVLLLAGAWAADRLSVPPPPEPLPVELVTLAPPEPQPTPPPPEPVKEPEPPRPKAEVRPPPLPRPVAPAIRRPVPAAAAVAVSEPAAETPPAVPVAVAAPPQSSPATESAGAVADQMGLYLAEVRRKLQAHLDYPFAARRMKLGGTVHLRLHVGMDGGVEGRSIAVITSSGAEILDEAGIVTVRRAAPFPPPPGGRGLVINVPVVFELRRG